MEMYWTKNVMSGMAGPTMLSGWHNAEALFAPSAIGKDSANSTN
jgi:hypothetical protein